MEIECTTRKFSRRQLTCDRNIIFNKVHAYRVDYMHVARRYYSHSASKRGLMQARLMSQEHFLTFYLVPFILLLANNNNNNK